MGFSAAVRACLSRYAVFSGRARRPEYWWFLLFTILAGIAATLLDIGLGTGTADGGLFAGLTGLALLVPTLAAAWRRLHDTGRPGWYALLPYGVGLLSGLLLVGLVALAGPGGGAPPLALRVLAPLAGFGALAAFILVVVWLASPTRPGPNRFGPEPPAA